MNVLFALVSIFIIYPVIYFLPFRFNAKQKFFLLIISLIISLLGIVLEDLIPLWKTALLMVAFAGLASMVISKRMPEAKKSIEMGSNEKNHLLYPTLLDSHSNLSVPRERSLDDNSMEQKIEKSVPKGDLQSIVSAKISEIMGKDLFESKESNEEFPTEHLSELFVSATLENDEVVEHNSNLEDLVNLEKINDIEINEMFNDHFDDFEFLSEIEEKNIMEDSLFNVESKQSDSSQYLSEIEKLLQEDDIEEVRFVQEPKLKEIKLEKLY